MNLAGILVLGADRGERYRELCVARAEAPSAPLQLALSLVLLERHKTLMAIAAVLFLGFCCSSFAADAPEAPSPQRTVQAKFWTFRGVYRDAKGHKRFNWNAPALKTTRKSWAVFIVEHGLIFGALAAANRQKEPWHSEIVPVLVVTGADFGVMKLLSPAMAIEAPIYSITHYLEAR